VNGMTHSCRTHLALPDYSAGRLVARRRRRPARAHHYFAHLTTLPAVLSAILAVVLWPLVVIRVDLHLK